MTSPKRPLMAIIAAALCLTVVGCTDGGDPETDASIDANESTTVPLSTRSTQTPSISSSIIPSSTASLTTSPPSAPPASVVDTIPEFDLSAVSPIVEAFVDDRGLNGAGLVVVDRDAGIVYENYWGEFDAGRVSLIASSSKMLVAGVLLRLQDDGLLDIDAPVADVAAWGAGNPDITPAQLISNSSGLVGLFPDPAFGPYRCQYLPAGSLQGCAKAIMSTNDDDADVAAPDTEFRYGGGQWQVAGAVAEVASGKPWTQLVDEIYSQPCGLDTLGFSNHWAQFGASGFDYPTEFGADPSTLSPTDNPNIEGGAYITARDYAEVLLMHLRGGKCGDNRVLSQTALDVMHSDRIAAAYDGDAGADTGYGMGWWVDRATGRLTDPGAYGAIPWLDLDAGYGAYLVIEADTVTGYELAAQLYEPIESALIGS